MFLTLNPAKSIKFACIQKLAIRIFLNLIVTGFTDMNTSKKIRVALGIGLLSGCFSSAVAATSNNNLTISVNVVATCSIQSPSLQQVGSVSVNCSNGATYAIAANQNPTADVHGDVVGVTVSY